MLTLFVAMIVSRRQRGQPRTPTVPFSEMHKVRTSTALADTYQFPTSGQPCVQPALRTPPIFSFDKSWSGSGCRTIVPIPTLAPRPSILASRRPQAVRPGVLDVVL